MCGIAGFSGRFSEEMLHDASARIAHRGPDGVGTYLAADCVGLTHRRLAIIDPSLLGAQPMSAEDDVATLVFNGEIYNFPELRDELSQRGVRFVSHSDTEVLLQLYLTEGEAMLRRLNGIFAFAIWDRRDASLFIARDGLGVKPLYYAQTARGFAFASEIKALLELAPEARELDAVALHRYLTFLYCPGDGTPLRDVKKVAPGEAMRVRDGQVERRWTWYQLPVFDGPRPIARESEAAEELVAQLRRAVTRQLIADVPVGAFLSGGLDSSAIVAFAREQVPDIRCFTIETTGDQDAGFVDDLPYARRAAKHLGVPLDVVTVDARRMAADLETMIWQLDEPLADPATLNVLYICELARRHGIKVLLSGAGGDDLFSGYRRHVALDYEKYWRWLPALVRAGLEQATAHLNQERARNRRITKAFAGATLVGDERLAAYFHWNREADLLPLYSRAFRAAATSESPDRPLLEFIAPLSKDVDPLNRMLALEQRFFLADHNLTYTDKMSMAAGVEVRVPFLDLDLVDFAARIPARLKQHGKTSKWIFKRAMEQFLPHDIIYRPKSGFGAPLRRWMHGELRALVADVLSPESIRDRGLFDGDAVKRLIRRNADGEVDGAYALLSLMSIEIWCRRFLDTPAITSQ